MDNNEEVWKDIPNWKQYQVSNKGNVKSLNYNKTGKERILKPSLCSMGYPMVGLSVNGKSKSKRVHRIVAETFIPNPEGKPNINHINGIKTDNRVENLEWCTQKENIHHSEKNGLAKHARGEKAGRSKLSSADVFTIKTEMKDFSIKKICETFNVSATTISNIRRNKTWKHIQP